MLVWGVGSGVGTAALLIAKALGGAGGRDLARRREARARARARRGRGRQPRDGRRGRGGPRDRRAATGSTSSSSTSARRPGRRRSRWRHRRAHRRLRGDERSESAGQPPPDLVEAALRPRLDDGHAARTSRACSSWSREAARSRSSTSVFPLDEAAAAHGTSSRAEQLGKVVLRSATLVEDDPARDVVRAARGDQPAHLAEVAGAVVRAEASLGANPSAMNCDRRQRRTRVASGSPDRRLRPVPP